MTSLADTYYLAARARSKLTKEASRADHNLRVLVSHANLLDNLMDSLHTRKMERERELRKEREQKELKVQFALPSKPSVVVAVDAAAPLPLEHSAASSSEDDLYDDADYSSSSDSDSDDEEEYIYQRSHRPMPTIDEDYDELVGATAANAEPQTAKLVQVTESKKIVAPVAIRPTSPTLEVGL